MTTFYGQRSTVRDVTETAFSLLQFFRTASDSARIDKQQIMQNITREYERHGRIPFYPNQNAFFDGQPGIQSPRLEGLERPQYCVDCSREGKTTRNSVNHGPDFTTMTSRKLPSSVTLPRRFNTTQWSLVLRAQQIESNDSRAAWDDLIRSYWYPLYAFCRQRGSSNDDAMDLTQGFFVHLLSAEGLTNVGQQRGRFRSFLMTAFRNYIVNEHHSRTTVKRGGTTQTESVPTFDHIADFSVRSVDFQTPEEAFDRSWVHSLLSRVLDRLRNEYAAANKSRLFEAIEPSLTNDSQQRSHAEISQLLAISPAAVAMSILRMRRRYGDILREEVAATLDNTNDVEDELRQLLEILSR